MTGREPDLLYGLLALRLAFITEEQLIDATVELLGSPGRDFAAILIGRRYLGDAEAEIVRSAAIAHLRANDEADVALRKFEIPRAVLEAWKGHRNSPSTAETLLVPHTGRPNPPTGHPVHPSHAGGPVTPRPLILSQPADRKYILGDELGRGGIGRVMEALDTDIERTVALKLVLEDAPAEALERFRWEGKITGRLEHPNIVPVHDVGVLPSTKEVYVAMKRIAGRDMLHVIHDGGWKQRRLVEAFRDVCRGVAYAHSKGVVHRDLKPANVMLGDFGEVLIVDWGLARVLSESERTSSRSRPRGTTRKVKKPGEGGDSKSSKLTLEGQILGTPSYMPPEQAKGRMDEVDERSDVWSLGAMLYEILSLVPPFEHADPWETIKQVTTREVKPPSLYLPCPPELEAICLKALSKRKEDRYASGAELAAEVDAYLEGTKERERREKLAAEQVGRAQEEIGKWRKLEAESKKFAAQARAMSEEVKAHDPLPKKKELWELQDRELALERQSLRSFAEADAALTSALSNVPEHADARRLKAEMFWEKFLEAEAAGDERSALLHRQIVERHDDGTFEARLRGEGTLTVRTRAYPCRCLSAGRSVSPDQLSVYGHHPWSGRTLSGKGSQGARELEPDAPLELRVHAASCAPAPLDGARVWAFRYVEMDRALVPMTVGAGKPKIPEAVLNSLFGPSPYRPRGGGQFLGETPIPKRPWPMGSWLLVVSAEGHAPMAVPVAVGRQEDLDLDVTLFDPADLPDGFLPIPAGRFPFQTGRIGSRNGSTLAAVLDVDDFLLARQPVTCRDYARFLNALPAAEASRRVPRASDEGAAYWPRVEPGGYVVPTAAWLESARPKDRAPAARLRSAPGDWEEDWPVLSVSWSDAAAYSHWAALEAGRVFCLPHEEQWEKAARGPDGRTFPWGSHFDAMRCNLSETHADGLRPVSIEAFPSDESPYGIRGMAGNSRDWCLNDPGGRRYRDWRVARGGMWNATGSAASPLRRFGFVPDYLEPGQGFRLAAVVRLAPAK